MTDATLVRLLLNTGDLDAFHRAAADQDLIDHLYPVVDGGGGPVPGVDTLYLKMLLPGLGSERRPGSAFFQIGAKPGLTKFPAVMAVACWAVEREAGAWSHATRWYGALEARLKGAHLWRPIGPKPANLPWIVGWQLPHIADLDRDTRQKLDGLVVATTWALMT